MKWQVAGDVGYRLVIPFGWTREGLLRAQRRQIAKARMMSVTAFIAAQMPAKTSSMAARVRKYWPLTQDAIPTLKMPLMRPIHQNSLKARCVNA